MKVLAIVNGKEITEKDVNALLEALGPQRAMQFYSAEGRETLRDELINQELLYLDAIEQGFDQEEICKQEIEKAKDSIIKQYAVKKLINTITVEESEIEDYYNNHTEQFMKKESVKASHILVDDEEKANEILSEIKDGLSFEEAAKNYSKCPSKARGGDLGFFNRGQMVAEFENVAFDMKKDEISSPVKTQFGYHLIKSIDKKEAELSTLSEVSEQINQQLIDMKQNQLFLAKTNELKDRYEVKIIKA